MFEQYYCLIICVQKLCNNIISAVDLPINNDKDDVNRESVEMSILMCQADFCDRKDGKSIDWMMTFCAYMLSTTQKKIFVK